MDPEIGQILYLYLNRMYTGNLLANSVDPDEMQHHAAFHQGLHCLLRLKQPSVTEIYHNFENTKCDPFKMHNVQSHVYGKPIRMH